MAGEGVRERQEAGGGCLCLSVLLLTTSLGNSAGNMADNAVMLTLEEREEKGREGERRGD